MSGMVSHVNGIWCLPIICFSHELGENYRIARLSTKSKNGVVGIGRPPCSVCGLTMRSAAGASKFYLSAAVLLSSMCFYQSESHRGCCHHFKANFSQVKIENVTSVAARAQRARPFKIYSVRRDVVVTPRASVSLSGAFLMKAHLRSSIGVVF